MKEEKNQKEEALESLKSILDFSQKLKEQAERIKEETINLQNDIDFYKASIRRAEALISTLKLMENEEDLNVYNVSDILIATMIMFEDKGLIKIIRKE